MNLVYIYYVLMSSCFVLSLFYLRFPLVRWLGALLLISILTETIVEIIGKKDTYFFGVYHFFVPIEYVFITLILRQNTQHKPLRRLLLYSTFCFCLISIYLSLFVLPADRFPSIHGNIEGALIIAWCLLSLLSIEPVGNLSIFQLPVFWVTLAFLVYFMGTMTINGVYNNLLANHSPTARHLFSIINSISNYLLYLFLIVGIICHKWIAKSSLPSSASP